MAAPVVGRSRAVRFRRAAPLRLLRLYSPGGASDRSGKVGAGRIRKGCPDFTDFTL